MKALPMSETELAQHFVDYYRDYEVYKEVPLSGGRCDMVVKAGPLLIAVEVKTSLNLKVIAQAMRHRGRVHFVNIAVPAKSVDYTARELCQELGIGVLGYDPNARNQAWRSRSEHKLFGELHVREFVSARYCRPKHLPRLHEAMKLSIAGAQHNSMSEFRITVLEIRDLLQKNGGKVSIKEFFKNHGAFHYGSTSSARQCIARIAGDGNIPEFTYQGGYLILNEAV